MFNRVRSPVAVGIVITFLVAVTALWLLRAPIRNAAKIKPGDSAAKVHKLLGEPDAAFETTAELQASYLGPMSYVFTDNAGRSGIRW